MKALIGRIEAAKAVGPDPESGAYATARLSPPAKLQPGAVLSPAAQSPLEAAWGLPEVTPSPEPELSPVAAVDAGGWQFANDDAAGVHVKGGAKGLGYSFSIWLQDDWRLYVPSLAGLEGRGEASLLGEGKMGLMLIASASWLAIHNWSDIRPKCVEMLATFLGEDFPTDTLNVNRLDYRVDQLAPGMPGELQDEAYRVTRGRTWSHYGTGRVKTGILLGKSEIVFRCYAKCEEALAKKNIDFWLRVWNLPPRPPDATRPLPWEGWEGWVVRRFEWELHKDYLRDFPSRELDFVLAHMGDLIRPLVQDMEVTATPENSADQAPATGEILRHSAWLQFVDALPVDPETGQRKQARGKHHEREPLAWWVDYTEYLASLAAAGDLLGEGCVRVHGLVRELKPDPLRRQIIGCALAHDRRMQVRPEGSGETSFGQFLRYFHFDPDKPGREIKEWRPTTPMAEEVEATMYREEVKGILQDAMRACYSELNAMDAAELRAAAVRHKQHFADLKWAAQHIAAPPEPEPDGAGVMNRGGLA